MGRVDNCCCCFSIQTGTHIIGVLTILSAVGEFNHPGFNPFRWAAKLFVAGVYVWMLMRDNGFTRMAFFFSYVAGIFAMVAVNIATSDSDNPEQEKVMDRLSFDSIAKSTCESMKAEDRENLHYSSLKECEGNVSKNLKGMVYFTFFVFGVVGIAIAVHFSMVLYSHWCNATLPKEEGGTGEDEYEGGAVEEEEQ